MFILKVLKIFSIGYFLLNLNKVFYVLVFIDILVFFVERGLDVRFGGQLCCIFWILFFEDKWSYLWLVFQVQCWFQVVLIQGQFGFRDICSGKVNQCEFCFLGVLILRRITVFGVLFWIFLLYQEYRLWVLDRSFRFYRIFIMFYLFLEFYDVFISFQNLLGIVFCFNICFRKVEMGE